jgi:hypothetical protein
VARKFTEMSGMAASRSMGGKLIDTVDQARDLMTRYGLRPYTVRLVITRWTGGERGKGEEYVASAVPILPTPKVNDLTGVAAVNTPIGWDESGRVTLSKISGRYTGETLRGLDSAGNPPSADEQFFYEIEYAEKTGPGSKRRFYPRGAPFWDAAKFEWRVELERQADDRQRSGDLR